MNIDEFWSFVERVHVAAPYNMDEKCRRLTTELRQLPCEEILSFGRHFTELFYQAYNWELWAAAYMIRHGCSDDSFRDVRSRLIWLVREAYTTALRDVDSLVEFNIAPEWAAYEGYQYVAGTVYEEKCGSHVVNRVEDTAHRNAHPKEPTGRDWHEWELYERYPRLAAKYGWDEKSGSTEKKRYEKRLGDEEKGRRLAQLMLEAGIIPSCGLIPPPRIALPVIRAGRSPSPVARVQSWESFDIDEGHYWIAVHWLHQPSPAALSSRSDLAGVRISVDAHAGTATTYADWQHSLESRGLAWP